MRKWGVALAALWLLVCGAASAAYAQNGAEAEARPGVPEPVKDPASGVVLQGLMRLLSEKVIGQRVVAVAPMGDQDRDLDAAEYARARTLLERLQVISEAQSDPTGASRGAVLIPFRVGDAYAIAPDVREAVNTDLRNLGPLDVTAPGALMAQAILAVDPQQYAALASPTGIAVGALPREAQERIARALSPPLKIIRRTPTVTTDAAGVSKPDVQREDVRALSEPIDWGSARIRVNLRVQTLHATTSDGGVLPVFPRPDEGLMFQDATGSRSSAVDGVDLPLFRVVPNTYKPSDLEGRRYPRPFGLSGVWKAEDVVRRLASVTGLDLRVWRVWAERPVFIGSEAVTAGEVMDALRIGLGGAWRKLDDVYLLAYDRLPLRAIQMMAEESSEAAARQARKAQNSMRTDARWLPLARDLPFAPDDPLALLPDQRARLFPTDANPGRQKPGRREDLAFTELTPDQQSVVRERARISDVLIPSNTPGVPTGSRPLLEADLAGMRFQAEGALAVSMQIPGSGWVRAPEAWSGLSFFRWQLRAAAEKAARDAQPDRADTVHSELKEMLDELEPVRIAAPVRAVITPAFAPARLNDLADEMSRHGLNTLFYPAFFGGYATFPSKAFPLHPALRGENGFAAAVAAMKPKSIAVVGYLNTLAWQNAGDKAHWLNKYPQWLDVDALGRPRLAWLDAHPENMDAVLVFGVSPTNYVRPAEPAVEARLMALVAEFANVKDTAGFALAEWNAPDAPVWFRPDVFPPSLGLALPDRLAALKQTGEDPGDAATRSATATPDLRALLALSRQRTPSRSEPDAHSALATRILAEAKKRRPDWTTYLLGAPDNPRASAPPKADQTLVLGGMGRGTPLPNRGVYLPITRGSVLSVLAALGDDEELGNVSERVRRIPALAGYAMLGDDSAALRNAPIIALDFRYAPNAISENLKWLQPAARPPGRSK